MVDPMLVGAPAESPHGPTPPRATHPRHALPIRHICLLALKTLGNCWPLLGNFRKVSSNQHRLRETTPRRAGVGSGAFVAGSALGETVTLSVKLVRNESTCRKYLVDSITRNEKAHYAV